MEYSSKYRYTRHVVYSIEDAEHGALAHVITVYQPDPLEWDGFFTKSKT